MSKKGNNKPNIWVNPHPDGGWQQKHEGSDRASRKSDKKSDILGPAKEQAKREGVELIVTDSKGVIQSKDSYGKDPNPPKDKEH